MPTPKKSAKAKPSLKLKDISVKRNPKGGLSTTNYIPASRPSGWNTAQNKSN